MRVHCVAEIAHKVLWFYLVMVRFRDLFCTCITIRRRRRQKSKPPVNPTPGPAKTDTPTSGTCSDSKTLPPTASPTPSLLSKQINETVRKTDISTSGIDSKTPPHTVSPTPSLLSNRDSYTSSEVTNVVTNCKEPTDHSTSDADVAFPAMCHLISVSSSLRAEITGSIRVKNLHYEKEVFVRWTVDNWVTYVDTSAEHHAHSEDGESDDFSFGLVTTEDSKINVQLAVCYRTPNGEEFWDNNSGENFTLTM